MELNDAEWFWIALVLILSDIKRIWPLWNTRTTANMVNVTLLATSLTEAHWLDRPTGEREVMGSIPVGNLYFSLSRARDKLIILFFTTKLYATVLDVGWTYLTHFIFNRNVREENLICQLWFFPSAYPKITNTSSTGITILVGYPLNLTCVVVGDPKPVVAWRKFGIQEIPGAVYEHGNFTLLIHQVSITDEGVYQCLGTSAAGAISTNFTVVVLGSYHMLFYSRFVTVIIERRCKSAHSIFLSGNIQYMNLHQL